MAVLDEIINFYINHPPFELPTESIPAYTNLISSVVDNTLIEYSEYFPILSEKEFVTTGNMIDIYDDIDEKLLTFVMFIQKDRIYNVFSDIYYNDDIKVLYRNANSILEFVSYSDHLYLLEEWFAPQMEYLIYEGSKIKVDINVTYYALYKRYRNFNEIWMSDKVNFKKLFEINLLMTIYQSDIFSSEGGIRSVSLSGLSVSFNVPTTETYIKQLEERKQSILTSLIEIDDLVESF